MFFLSFILQLGLVIGPKLYSWALVLSSFFSSSFSFSLLFLLTSFYSVKLLGLTTTQLVFFSPFFFFIFSLFVFFSSQLSNLLNQLPSWSFFFSYLVYIFSSFFFFFSLSSQVIKLNAIQLGFFPLFFPLLISRLAFGPKLPNQVLAFSFLILFFSSSYYLPPLFFYYPIRPTSYLVGVFFFSYAFIFYYFLFFSYFSFYSCLVRVLGLTFSG